MDEGKWFIRFLLMWPNVQSDIAYTNAELHPGDGGRIHSLIVTVEMLFSI